MELHNLEIIVGTYEEFLLGYRIVQQGNEEYELVQSFATHSHRASVRSVATGGKFLASGGTDESIFLYDMTTRKENGLLMHHNGTISCLDFAPDGTHLLSGCEDGSIGACRTGSWQLEKLWSKAHKGSAVTSVSIHPSGKLFLSVGIDGTIRTWNFIKGRPAYTTHLCKLKEARSITQVLWCPKGETYSVVIGKRVEVFNVTRANVVYAIELDSKITCICYLNSSTLCAASEDGNISIYNIKKKTIILQFAAHEGRVRSIACFKSKFLISSMSSGQIKLWNIDDLIEAVLLCETSTGCRITCMTLVDVQSNSFFDELQSKKLIPVKVESDKEIIKSKPNSRSIGVVTVEVDEPGDNEEENVNVSAKKKKKKKKKKKLLNTSSVNNIHKKHKKKKRDCSDAKSSFVIEDVNDVILDTASNTQLHGKLKKKSKRNKLGDETSNNNVSLKKLSKVKKLSTNSLDVTDKCRKKSQTTTMAESVTADFSRYSVPQKRKASEFEIVESEQDVSATQKKRKMKGSKEVHPAKLKKKSRKSKSSDNADNVSFPGANWIIE